MIIERPLHGTVEVQAAFTMLNRAPFTVFTTTFESYPEAIFPLNNPLGWFADGGVGNTRSARWDRSSLGAGEAVVGTFTGLVAGRRHRLQLAVKPESGTAVFGVSIGGAAASVTASTGFVTLTLEFVANATTAPIRFIASAASAFRVDNVSLTRLAYTDPAWTSITDDATGIAITRGGARDGLGIKTDVGLLTFALKNAQDPLDGGSIIPGQAVRAIANVDVTEPAAPFYETGWEPSIDGWTAQSGSVTRPTGTNYARTGNAALNVYGAAAPQAGRLLTGLTPGRTYTVTVWARHYLGYPGSTAVLTDYLVGISIFGGAQTTARVSTTAGVWTQLTHTFTATSASQRLLLSAGAGTTGTQQPDVVFDDLVATANMWTTRKAQPIFTGRVAFLGSSYPLDKATGVSRTVTTVTVSDAVAIHNATMRYGRDIAAGFETFEDRIGGLAASANAAIEVPPAGAPREVYVL